MKIELLYGLAQSLPILSVVLIFIDILLTLPMGKQVSYRVIKFSLFLTAGGLMAACLITFAYPEFAMDIRFRSMMFDLLHPTFRRSFVLFLFSLIALAATCGYVILDALQRPSKWRWCWEKFARFSRHYYEKAHTMEETANSYQEGEHHVAE